MGAHRKYLAKTTVFAVAILMSGTTMAALPVAGKIFKSKGQVHATAVGGEKRKMRAKSEIFTGDTLETGKRSISKVRLDDGAFFVLRPQTSFTVDQYSFKGAGADGNTSSFKLAKGGVRFVSGDIGKGKGENKVALKSPTSSISLLGTDIFMFSDGETTYTVVFDGAVSKTNFTGGAPQIINKGEVSFTNKEGKTIKKKLSPSQLTKVINAANSETNVNETSTLPKQFVDAANDEASNNNQSSSDETGSDFDETEFNNLINKITTSSDVGGGSGTSSATASRATVE